MRQIEEMELQMNKQQKITQKANELLDTYEEQLDPRVYELAKKEVNKKIEPKTPEIEEAKKEETAPKKKIIRRRKIED